MTENELPHVLYFRRCAAIQADCSCRRLDEYDCHRSRYPDDLDDDDGNCECFCHVEIDELARDIWPEEDCL